MTKLITALIVVVVLFCAWQGWKFAQTEINKEDKLKEDRPPLQGYQLPGMPQQWETALANSQQNPTTFRKWLETYGDQLQDPRKAWIQLDFAIAIVRDNPAEAKRLYDDVKARTGSSSQVYPRVKELEKTFQ
jgi:hypothetical protein